MTRDSLQSITPQQSENKKVWGLLEQIQDPFKALALLEKDSSQYFLKAFRPSQ